MPLEVSTHINNESDVLAGTREQFATQLIRCIGHFRQGAVLMLDAPWGEGKTWFAGEIMRKINVEGSPMRGIYLDAFKTDFVDDPFLAITAEIQEAVKDDASVTAEVKKELMDSAKRVACKAVPIIGRMTLNAVGRFIGTSELSEDAKTVYEAVLKETESVVSEYVEEKIKGWSDSKKSIEEYKEALKKISARRQVVFIVDELDRCTPTYAVKLLERIKHFFDVDGATFLLLAHRPQLEASVRGVYGADLDAHTYLQKFIHLNLSFPKPNDIIERHQRCLRYTQYLQEKFKKPDGKTVMDDIFPIYLAEFGVAFNLTLRDLERVYISCVFTPFNNNFKSLLMHFLKPLQLSKPDLFLKIRSGDKDAAKKVIAILDGTKFDDVRFQYGGDGCQFARGVLKIYCSLVNLEEAIREDGDVMCAYRATQPYRLRGRELIMRSMNEVMDEIACPANPVS